MEPTEMPPPPARPPGLLARFLRWMTEPPAPAETPLRMDRVFPHALDIYHDQRHGPHIAYVMEMVGPPPHPVLAEFYGERCEDMATAFVELVEAKREEQKREDAYIRAQMQYGTHW